MRSFSRLIRVATLALATASIATAAACGRADASASRDSAKTTLPATTANQSGAVAAPMYPALAPGDTLSDSLLIARADAGRLMGRDSGAIWLIVMSDFQCPYCKVWHDSVHANVKRDYVDKGTVRVAYLNLPLPQHPHARAEAEASLCASAQGRFWEYSAGLFHEQATIGRLTTVEPTLDSLARANALDLTEFARCRKSRAVKSLVESDIQQATRTGVRSTPSFLVGDFLVEGASPYPNFRRAIDTALVVARMKGRR